MRGYTRTGAFGPIAAFVDLHGGSIKRVFDRVDLPLTLLERPDLPLPLAEQYRVLKAAGYEIGDPFIGASLGRSVNLQHLGAFGHWMCEAPTLANLIDRCERGIGRYLQTATRIRFQLPEGGAQLSIEFLERRYESWLQNELLGVSYLIDCVRQFMGRSWTPTLIRSTCSGTKNAAALEKIFEAPVRHDAPISSIQFDPSLLSAINPRDRSRAICEEPALPNIHCCHEDVSALLAIAILEKRPNIDWVASKKAMSRRSMQRSLEAEGYSFLEILEQLLKDRAIELLRSTDQSVTDVGLSLGYSDCAHFTRAFSRWTGFCPSQFRSADGSNTVI